MFLDWIAQLGLLHHDPVSNILGRFPLHVKKTLITEVASTLLMTSDLTLLSSMAHMHWVMEVLGQGFAMPLEELPIAQETTRLYSQWLFEPLLRPLAFKRATGTQDEQLLYQTIFHHYSLLFQARPLPNTATQQRAPPASAPTLGSSNISINSNLNNHLHLLHHQTHNATPTVPISALIQRHVELCKKVLTVLTMAGRQLGSSFSEETWDVLLKVTLGITDCLLREPSDKTSSIAQEYSRMSDDLCEHLLRVLFELWLRSGTQKVEMWDILKRCFAGWTHRAPAIHQWAATSLGLGQRVVRLLYGPGQGSDNVNLAVGGYNVGLDLQAEFVYYAWHRITYLLINPARLPPGNCLIAVNGIGRLVETFLAVGRNPMLDDHHHNNNHHQPNQQPVTPPDGNTLMHMYGSWLFDISAISSSPSTHHIIAPYAVHETYHEAQASAFGVLCRIFSRPQPADRPFLRIYTERFYDALSKGLRNETCLPTILAHSAELFTSDLAGVRMMVPDFVVGIRMAMSGRVRVLGSYKSPEKQKQTLEDLYLAALKVVGCIICLPNYFDKVELKEGWSLGLLRSAGMSMDAIAPREDKEILAQLIRVLYTDEDSSSDPSKPKKFTTLKYYILEMLLNCLETETSPHNLRYLLHLIEVYVYEDVAFCPGLVGVVVKTIQEKIVPIQVPVEVALCAFDVLMGCSRLYEHVKRDSKSCARELVLALCRYVDALLANHSLLKTTYPLIVRAYECMIQWILAGQWIVGDQDCQMAVISSLSSGIHIAERVEEFETAHVAPKPTQEKRRWGAGGSGASAMMSAVGAPLVIGRPNHNTASKLFQNSKSPGATKFLQQKDKEDNQTKRNRSSGSTVLPGIGLTIKPQQRNDLLAIQQAAELGMTQFSLQLSNFPVWINDLGPARVSTLWDDIRLNRLKLDEIEQARDKGDYNPYPYHPQANTVGPVRYFLVDKKIILGCTEPIPPALTAFAANGASRRTSRASTFDPRLNGTDGVLLNSGDDGASEGPSVIVTMRDTNGKNSWKIQMRYLDKSVDQPPQDLKNGRRRDGSSSSETADDRHSNTTMNSTTKTTTTSSTSTSSFSSASKRASVVPELKIPKPRVLYVEAADEASIGLSRVESSSDVEDGDSERFSQKAIQQNGGRHGSEDDSTRTGTTASPAMHQRSATGSESTSSQGIAAFSEGESMENGHSLTNASNVTGAEIFRILLAQMGYLSVENRHRIIPLHLTDSLLTELESLDNLKERETFSISVYYAHNGDVSYSELVHGSPLGLPRDFTRFLDCLGWPILVESHPGYLGQLNKNICKTAPYYADRTCEVIFHVPYLIQLEPDVQEQTHPRATPPSSFSSSGRSPLPSTPSSLGEGNGGSPFSSSRNSSHLFIPDMGAEAQRHRFEARFRQMVAEDHVAVVWIEDRERMMQLPALIGQQAMVYLMIHPLKGTSTGGLFWIRIVIHGSTAAAVRLSQNPLMIGPLVDGMLVSRHGLGSLIRNTAISAERACRVVSDSFSQPTAVRTKFIQEFSQRLQHQGPETISEFYGAMWSMT